MKTLDPRIREAAQRVTAWHVARWRAHNEATESAGTGPETGRAAPAAPEDDGKTSRVSREAAQRGLAS